MRCTSLRFTILNFILQYSIIHVIQGEEYKLFWPEQTDFVRVAARFGAKIIPFGVVGEDDIGQVSLVIIISFAFGTYINYTYTFNRGCLVTSL